MKTIHNEHDRASIIARVQRVAPDTPAQWGKFDAPRMIAHVTDAVRMATGELPVREKRTPLASFPLKHLVLYVLPFPKSTPTAPELLARAPGEWAGEVAQFLSMVEGFAALGDDHRWPRHPIFGAMDRKAWGALVYKHTDHHLRQFGA